MPSTALLPWMLATAFALQPPGQFHGDEVVARDGERWLALRADAGAAALTPAKLRVSAVHDPVLDAPEQRSGRLVASDDDTAVIAYLRGDGLRTGPVDTASVAPGLAEAPTPLAHAIGWRGRRFHLQAQCDPQAAGTEPAARDADAQPQTVCRLVLDDGERRQVLQSMTGYREAGTGPWLLGDDATPQLLFAGDLDRDGRLDLILDTTDHYNLMRLTLFLSSQAADGALVGVAAVHDAVGC